jgi:hypothetical protein
MAKTAKKTVAPKFATVDHGHDKPRIPFSPMFMLVFVPTRWMIMEGKLVPQLTKVPLDPGSNLVEGTKDGIRASRLSARMAEEGRKRIPFEWAPDGESYIQVVETRVGQSDVETYVSVFEEVYAGDSETHPDTMAYAAWLEDLVKSKKLPPCPPFQVRRMMEQEEARLLVAEASVKAHDTGPNRAAAEAHQANLKTLKAAWTKVNPKAAGKKPVAKKAATPKIEA